MERGDAVKLKPMNARSECLVKFAGLTLLEHIFSLITSIQLSCWKLMKALVPASLIALSSILSTSCSMMPSVRNVWSKNVNVAGAFERYPKSFNPVHAGTLRTSTDEIWYRRNFSGGQTKFLWGLLTITDY